MKLIIAEDNRKMREMIKSVFSDKFNLIYECEDGGEAVIAFRHHKPDWVFMDLKMKNMDGITATREIIKEHPEAKIIIVTDFGDKSFMKEALEAGAHDYVLKENILEIFKIIRLTNYHQNPLDESSRRPKAG